MKHAPAPWHTCPNDCRLDGMWVRHRNEKGQIESIAKILRPFARDREWVAANARLIEQAPELLKQLQAAVDVMQGALEAIANEGDPANLPPEVADGLWNSVDCAGEVIKNCISP